MSIMKSWSVCCWPRCTAITDDWTAGDIGEEWVCLRLDPNKPEDDERDHLLCPRHAEEFERDRKTMHHVT